MAAGLVEIVITVCAVAHPSTCEQRSFPLAWNGSLRECSLAAPPMIAQYMGNFPSWTVSRWSCEYPGQKKHG